ncbi:MAG: cell division protein ZapA, partial [Chlorobi bacterium]|nr:cell division protein ZapA [Chlorobiota bacterium]
KINIGTKYYPMRINRNEEEIIRKSAKIINDKLIQYQNKYADREPFDLLAMTSLQYVKQLLECENKNDVSILNEELKQINDILENFIEQNK